MLMLPVPLVVVGKSNSHYEQLLSSAQALPLKICGTCTRDNVVPSGDDVGVHGRVRGVASEAGHERPFVKASNAPATVIPTDP
jgi:hypothetical protein|eukprot:COSAG06_NODE_4268_length_4417_cov_48.417554_6_plen_83_part_00